MRLSRLFPWLGIALALAGCSGADPPLSGGPGTAEQQGQQPDWDAMRDRQLADLVKRWRAMGHLRTLPTDVKFVRYLRPDEFGVVRADCMKKQGFDAVPTTDGGIEYVDIPNDQAEAQTLARYRCEVMYPVHPRYSMPLDERQHRLIYDYYVTKLVPCLRAHGYDPGAVPSVETFLATVNTKQSWSPYAAVNDRQPSKAEWEAINRDCPQSPPVEEIFGE